MGKTKIAWTQHVWNPIRGCSKVSAGCEHCYAERMAARFCRCIDDIPGPRVGQTHDPFYGVATLRGWTGRVELIEGKLDEPLRRKKPTVYFVNSMSDLFHPALPDEDIDRVFAVMGLCQRHRLLVLTKRPERMKEQVDRLSRSIQPLENAAREMGYTFQFKDVSLLSWPLPNLALGVSVENQAAADERIPPLLQTPAAMRFVSCEPLLGDVNLNRIEVNPQGSGGTIYLNALTGRGLSVGGSWDCSKLDWAIAGGESGPRRRRVPVDLFRSLRDQCAAANVPFFLKQMDVGGKLIEMPLLDGQVYDQRPEGW